MRPQGVLVINAFGSFDPGQDFLVASLHHTLASVFSSVRVHAADSGNTMFVASARQNLQMLRPPRLEGVHPTALAEVRAVFSQLRELVPQHGRVLTDDYNPVDFYDAGNRERLRRAAVARMRR